MVMNHPILMGHVNIGSYTLNNRLAHAAPVMLMYAQEDGYINDKHIAYYAEKAKMGFSMIGVETTCVTKDGSLFHKQLGIWDDTFMQGHHKIVSACKAEGIVAVLKLGHAGQKTPADVRARPIGASSGEYNGHKVFEATVAELEKIEKAFVDAAYRAFLSGYDGVEINAGSGSLNNQMVCCLSNRREDSYGGSYENRLRFTRNIVEGIRSATNRNFIVGIKMGVNDPDFNDGVLNAVEYEKIDRKSVV